MEETNDKGFYCSIGKIPKGKVLGTSSQCLEANQVRYYGKVAINPDIINLHTSMKDVSLIKEQLKLKKLQSDAKILVNDVKKLMIIIEHKDSTEKRIKRGKKEISSLLNKRDRLIKKLRAQEKKVKELEKDEKLKRKQLKKIEKETKSKKKSKK